MSKIEYRIIEGLPNEEVLAWVLKISNDAFNNEGSIAEMQQQLTGKRSILTCLAFEGDTPVGFKIGYEERPYYFESWRVGASKAHAVRALPNNSPTSNTLGATNRAFGSSPLSAVTTMSAC